jgi:hypothetical protein
VDQLDGDVVPAEALDELGERATCRVQPVGVHRAAHRALATAGEDETMAAGSGGKFVDVVHRTAFRAAAQVRSADRPGQRRITDRVAGQHEQVGTGRVGHTDARGDVAFGSRAGERDVERELGTEPGRESVRLGCLGESDDAVQAVMIGERQTLETQPDRLFGQLFRRGRAVEEAE